MTADDGALADAAREAIGLFAGTATMPLLPVLAVALIVGVIQTAMSINEQTLSFLPKVAALALVLVIGGGMAMRELGDFATSNLTALVAALHGQ